jgi:hypothetical protein
LNQGAPLCGLRYEHGGRLSEIIAHREVSEFIRIAEAFLSSFLGVSEQLVPPTSILREFIGHSSFRY